MKRFVIIFALICIISKVQSQGTGFSATAGFGSYSLTELKDYHLDLASSLPVDVKTFSMFPPYTHVRVNLFRQSSTGFKYGITYAQSTSGIHSNYTDFSGYLDLEQNLSAYQFGLSAGYRLLYSNFFEILAYSDLRLAYVRSKVNMNITTSYYYDNNKLVLTSLSPTAELGLNAMYHLKGVSVGLEGAYLLDMGSKFKVGEESSLETSYSLMPQAELHSQLSGFRAGIKLIYWFSNPLKIEE